MTRLDWGDWVDWARPDGARAATPSWAGRDDVPPVTNIRDLHFGDRND
jgi:hypothetical protein